MTEYEQACVDELKARAAIMQAGANLLQRWAALIDWAAPLARQLAEKAVAEATKS